eukprot:TRINITY_DN3830_c0_g2_i4.p1 TRINITY_DN3830_c0_g2~~TRINITY_DN3830_c0_g2_i4.p1  ORF type:complete len:665 (+),score=120.37 TRINITY_DN3830_c0_g2_i4:195-2189(+)
MFGWYKGVNGLTGKESNAINTSDPSSPRIFVDKNAPYVAGCDPDHGTTPTTYKIYGIDGVTHGRWNDPTMSGFVEWEHRSSPNACAVMSTFPPEKLPVINFLASEFVLFDRFFCSHPGPTWPNRLFMLSATSAGLTETGPWYHGEVGKLFPQKTIFDQVAEAGLTWKVSTRNKEFGPCVREKKKVSFTFDHQLTHLPIENYYNDTPWELIVETLAHNPDNLASMTQFFQDARDGNLPNFSWINPLSGINISTGVGSNDMHPDHDMAAGERYYKDIYEAVRASPQWNSTLLVITFDEHGGFYDHVPTPLNVPPPGDGEKSYPEKFLFNRLGIRVPTLLISPWVSKGQIVSSPPAKQKPAPNSEYELTSIIATTRKLLNMPTTPLTKRDAWAATFEDLLENFDEPRTDCPVHLPSPPPVTPPSLIREALKPPNQLQHHMLTVLSHLSDQPFPHHVKYQHQVSQVNQNFLHHHLKRTRDWKASKRHYTTNTTTKTEVQQYLLYCAPAGYEYWVDNTWNVNHVQAVPWMTISTKYLSSVQFFPTTSTTETTPYCLDSGVTLKPGTVVGVSLCYPSSDPTKNRDISQHWILAPDATIRPFQDQSLCLTNSEYSGTFSVTLQVCKDRVEQHWGYHGPAPGEGAGGNLFFGDDTNTLGVASPSLVRPAGKN